MSIELLYIRELIKMNKFKAFCIGLILIGLGAAAVASAETVELRWEHPTSYVNGAALPLADIVSTELECVSFKPNGSSEKQPCQAGTKIVPAPANTYSFDGGVVPPQGGEFEFVARTVVVSGAKSDNSNPAQKLFAAVKPSPPLLSVVEPIAYETSFKLLKFRVVAREPVGTVPVGTPCDPDARVKGTDLYAIPREAVTFTRETDSPVIVARCG